MTKPLKEQKLAIGIAALVVLACCGATVGQSFVGDPKKPAAAPSPTVTTRVDRLLDTATTTPASTPTDVAVAPTTTPPRKPAPKPSATTRPPTRTPTPAKTTKPPTRKPTPKATTPAVQQGVHPGSFCSRQGARGVSKTGKPMVCTTTAADPKKRWRAA